MAKGQADAVWSRGRRMLYGQPDVQLEADVEERLYVDPNYKTTLNTPRWVERSGRGPNPKQALSTAELQAKPTGTAYRQSQQPIGKAYRCPLGTRTHPTHRDHHTYADEGGP